MLYVYFSSIRSAIETHLKRENSVALRATWAASWIKPRSFPFIRICAGYQWLFPTIRSELSRWALFKKFGFFDASCRTYAIRNWREMRIEHPFHYFRTLGTRERNENIYFSTWTECASMAHSSLHMSKFSSSLSWRKQTEEELMLLLPSMEANE